MFEEESVARGWMMDFCFRSICRSYTDTNREKFSKNIKFYEAIVDDEHELQADQQIKRTICCFLSRVMDGQNLEVHYDKSDRVTPLMSALVVWECLSDAVADVALYENIRTLLYIQCVGVCLEKGNIQLAADTLQWLEKETALPEKLQRKLSTVVEKKNTYDQLLTNFSYTCLLDSINTFLQAFLEKHPSDFLLKSASKVVQARQEKSETVQLDRDLPESASMIHTADSSTTNENEVGSLEVNRRPKKKLLSTNISHPWKPETAKKTQCVQRRTAILKISGINCKGSPLVQKNEKISKHKGKKWWTSEEDSNLKAGVKRYGEGKWAKILEEFDFQGRTGVMLKDRWRTLKKHEKV